MMLKVARLLLVVCSFAVLGATPGWADPSVNPGSPEATSIVQPAVDALGVALGKPARLDVQQLKVSGDWAFVYASIKGLNGEPIDYTGTPYTEAAANHGMSHSYAGLLRQDGNGWAVVDQAIGPSDAAWQGWPRQYGVPEALVDVSAN